MAKSLLKTWIPVVLCLTLLGAPARAGREETRLTVFYPSVGTVRALAALIKLGYLEAPGLVVTGVYHEKEATRYEDSRKYVVENAIPWFRFHPVSAAIPEDALFRRNDCTPEFEKIFAESDGIIFFGGPDIPPSFYGEKTSLLTEIEDPVRHRFEVSAVFHLLGGTQDPAFKPLLEQRPDFPVLGICLGCQSLNVGTGGTLIQDIWSEVYGKSDVESIIALDTQEWHTNPYIKIYPQEKLIGYNFHRIRLDPKGPFCGEMGFKTSDEPRILSSHHQALDRLGLGFRPVAASMDGKIIEAVAHERFIGVLGVQFHPESPRLWEGDPVYRQKPGETPFSFEALLEGAPPSAAFNRAIWRWLSGKIRKRP